MKSTKLTGAETLSEAIDPALTGATYDLANAGYAPMPDPEEKRDEEAIGSDHASLQEAAQQLSASRDPIVTRQYVGPNGGPADAKEAVTLARAARDYAALTAAERGKAESKSSNALAEEIDALRTAALEIDPDAAEFYGFKSPEEDEATSGRKLEADRSEDRAGDGPDANLDAELARAMRHPQVLQAIEQQVGEAERARQSYRDGLAAATQIAQATFLSQFPEFAGIAQENLPAALAQMSRQDPAKLARVQAAVAATEQLFARQAQENQRHAQIEQQNFRKYAGAEDARLETMLKGEPTATQQAVMTEIMTSAKESGVEPMELLRLYHSERLMRNAVFQRMMYDAGKYRLMMKARSAAAARPVPPVQRPGMATTRSERSRGDLRTLSAKLSTSGDIKDAVALYQARKSSKP